MKQDMISTSCRNESQTVMYSLGYSMGCGVMINTRTSTGQKETLCYRTTGILQLVNIVLSFIALLIYPGEHLNTKIACFKGYYLYAKTTKILTEFYM